MGTLFYAVGITNRQAIELGKGWWDDPFKGREFTFHSLVKTLAEHFSDDFYDESLSKKDYIEQLANTLLSIDTSFELISESADPERYKGIKIVASRYTDDQTYVGHYLSDHLS
jgi:hypothetical protein